MSLTKKPKILVTHLYPKKMSIYGDIGNVIAINFYLQKYDLEMIYQPMEVGEDLPEKTDFYFIGGGQDEQQFQIFKDLVYKKGQLISDVEANIPLLAICGGYQLLGQKFVTGEGLEIDGIGLFDVQTKALGSDVKDRCVGNVVCECLIPDIQGTKLVGFENHSGQTEFISKKKTKPLAKVLFGKGNNLSQEYEGAFYKNAVGTYLHGSCLPKNPELAEYLILNAIRRKVENYEINPNFYLEIRNQKPKASLLAYQLRDNLVDRFLAKLR